MYSVGFMVYHRSPETPKVKKDATQQPSISNACMTCTFATMAFASPADVFREEYIAIRTSAESRAFGRRDQTCT